MLKSFSDGNEVSQHFCISIIQKIPYSESLWIEPLWMFEYLASWGLYSPVMPIEFQWHRCRFLRPLPDGPPPSTRSRICQGRQRSWILRQREGQQWWSGDALLANTLVGRGGETMQFIPLWSEFEAMAVQSALLSIFFWVKLVWQLWKSHRKPNNFPP